VNADGDPPLRPPVERRSASAVAWIAGTLLVIAALVIGWDPPPNPDRAAALALPSLPTLPDPASPSPGSVPEDAGAALPTTGASGTELIEVCGVGWVPPDASGAADRAAVAADRDVLASQRTLLDALRSRDGEVGQAMATVLELHGAGRENPDGNPMQALFCATAGAAACAGREEDRTLALSLIEQLAKRAAATGDAHVYLLALQECRWASGKGSCALLNAEQWARLDDGNAAPWLHILQRARDRKDAAQVEEALYRIGAATRYETRMFALAGKVADRVGASDVDIVAALLLAFDAAVIPPLFDPFAALTEACMGSALADANRRQACELAAETLAERSDTLGAVAIGAAIGRRLGWPADRVDRLRGLQLAATDEGKSSGLAEMSSSCADARRALAALSRLAREGEAQQARAWVASHGGPAAFVALPRKDPLPANTDDTVRPGPAVAQAASDASSAAQAANDAASVPLAAIAAALSSPVPSAVSSTPAASSAEAASSATPYSATPQPDR
jgi:hypothetical protein